MTDTSGLPAPPSLEQIRKQAKELLRDCRSGDPAAIQRFRAVRHAGDSPTIPEPTLADAQLILARHYGFESWTNLVRQVEGHRPSPHIERFEQAAKDLVAADAGDAAALLRLSDFFGRSLDIEQLRGRVRDRLDATSRSTEAFLSFSDAQQFIAQLYAFQSWTRFTESMAAPAPDPKSAALGLSTTPPFYRIDQKKNTLHLRPPLSGDDWDTLFDVMKELQITGLVAGGTMTDEVMHRLPKLTHLTRLNLEGSNRLTDEGLSFLAEMPQLEELDLSGWDMQIGDRGLGAVRQLASLRKFQMCWPRQVTDAGVANLASCLRLERVNLLGTRTGDGAIRALVDKPSLTHFSTGNLVTDLGLPLLHRFPVFQAWQGGDIRYRLMEAGAEPNQLVLGGSFTDRGFAELRGLDGLFGLSLFGDRSRSFTPAGLAPLRDLPNLGFLSCGDDFCDDEAMRQISTIPRLRMLLCQDTVASDDGFVALSTSPTVEYIWGRRCHNLKGRGFAALSKMPALRGLSVSCLNVDDAALSTLPEFPALREYMPMDVPDEGFRHVGKCRELEGLWCMYCRETGDVATGHIAGLSRLKTYYAGKTRITDRSMEVLGRLLALERIELWQTSRVTDAGLVHLAHLPRLRELVLDGLPRVTRDGAANLPPHVHVTIE